MHQNTHVIKYTTSPLLHNTANLKPRKTRKPDPSLPYHCLVRATTDKRKIATVVTAKDQPRFQESYNTILKAHMDALKKREKKKGEKKEGKA